MKLSKDIKERIWKAVKRIAPNMSMTRITQ